MNLAKYSDLAGKTVFITGGCSGIGAAMVRAFIGQNAAVAFVSNDSAAATLLCQQVHDELGDTPLFQYCDVQDIAQLQQCMDTVVEQLGTIDVLINNAANDKRHTLADLTPQQWDESLNTNLRPYFYSAQQVAPAMKANQQGSIINLSSNSAMLGLAGYPAYVTAKAGIIGLTKALARELGSAGIRVNTLVPGWVMTKKQQQLWVTPEALKQCLDQQCIPQTIEEQDIVQAALFLASDAAKMMTGQSMVIDGGRAL